MNVLKKMFSVTLFIASLLGSELAQANCYRYVSNYDLFRAIKNDDYYTFTDWLYSYPDLNIRNSQGRTPLMVAAQYKNYRFYNMLLDAGAHRYLVDYAGKTAANILYKAERPVVVTTSSSGGDVLTSVGVGLAAGLCAYALSGSDVSVGVRYDYAPYDYAPSVVNYESPLYGYCPSCGISLHYSAYCDCCYRGRYY